MGRFGGLDRARSCGRIYWNWKGGIRFLIVQEEDGSVRYCSI